MAACSSSLGCLQTWKLYQEPFIANKNQLDWKCLPSMTEGNSSGLSWTKAWTARGL